MSMLACNPRSHVRRSAAPLCWAPTSAFRSPVEGAGCHTDLDVPSELVQLSFQVCWLVGHFHDPVGGSVGNLSPDGRGRGALQEFVRSAVRVVGEEHLRRCINRSNVAPVAEQLTGPHAGTAGKLKHAAF